MLVHGGFNTEQKKVLNDFGMFDIELGKWINLRVYVNGERIDQNQYPYDES